MAKLKSMCELLAELLNELRNDVDYDTVPYVFEKTSADTIEVYVEDPKDGLIHYAIKMIKNEKVKTVFDSYVENDLVGLASVEGTKVSNSRPVCAGSLFHEFLGFDDPVQDSISGHYDMNFFRYRIQLSLVRNLNLDK